MKEKAIPGDQELTVVSLVIVFESRGVPFQAVPVSASSQETSEDCVHQSKWSFSTSHCMEIEEPAGTSPCSTLRI